MTKLLNFLNMKLIHFFSFLLINHLLIANAFALNSEYISDDFLVEEYMQADAIANIIMGRNIVDGILNEQEIKALSKAINMKTLLISIPQMVLPIVVFSICNSYFDYLTGCAAVASIGILGVLLKDVVFELIVKAYKTEKYSTLKAYIKN